MNGNDWWDRYTGAQKFVAGIQVHKNLLQQIQTKFAAKGLTNFSDSQVPFTTGGYLPACRAPSINDSGTHLHIARLQLHMLKRLEACASLTPTLHTQSHALQQKHHQ